MSSTHCVNKDRDIYCLVSGIVYIKDHLLLRPTKYIVGLWSVQNSRIDATMRLFCWVFLLVFWVFFLKTLFYLLDYFSTVLKRPSMKLAGASMPFCK